MQIAAVRLASADLAAQSRLYVDALGLSELDGPAGTLSVRVGASRLVFEPGRWSPQHVAFRIPSGAYADALDWLGARTALLPNADGGREHPFPDWNAHAMYFRDPDGNVLELIAHHDLDDPYEPPFSPAHLLAIGEAGLPVGDVPGHLTELERRHGIRRWSGDGVGFAAAGDKLGSLIVVPRGRPWHPVPGSDATAPPAAIEVAGLGALY
jgi:catechol 2,3-dioxygenase-like lactoylglutathione lyase family enzyme